MTQIDLSLSPVQDFIAKSRRTRDLWGSSFLLAFLTAHAMRGVVAEGGKIVQPLVDDDPMFKWVVQGNTKADPPVMGTLPNHFVAEVADGRADDVARSGTSAMKHAWRQVCDVTWNRFVASIAGHGCGTEDIWRRQTRAFWYLTWTVTTDHQSNSNACGATGLPPRTRRKLWRTHCLPSEPGDKCTVMSDYQELSGFARAASKVDRQRQDEFWKFLRLEMGGHVNLRENERLCSIALVKRVFPEVTGRTLGRRLDTSDWPSTVLLAAVPWIREATRVAPQRAASYARTVRSVAATSKNEPWIFQSVENHTDVDDFLRLDANWLHAEFVRDERRCPIEGRQSIVGRENLLTKLRELRESPSARGPLGPPPSYYAILLADGDRLGQFVADLAGGPDSKARASAGAIVGRSLARFTSQVSDHVRKHDGVAVYAGGDDVLAMLPVNTATVPFPQRSPDRRDSDTGGVEVTVSSSQHGALACAKALADCYRSAFRQERLSAEHNERVTLSAAIVFTHIRYPLGQALQAAHRLLDDVAKDDNGRDSLAVSVLKPGGVHCEWATTWHRKKGLGKNEHAGGSVNAIDQLNALVGSLISAETETGISSSLLYRIRAMLSVVCGWDSWTPGRWGTSPSELDLTNFVRAEVVQSLSKRTVADRDRADQLTELISDLLWRSHRRGKWHDTDVSPKIGLDALMLARFLANPRDE